MGSDDPPSKLLHCEQMSGPILKPEWTVAALSAPWRALRLARTLASAAPGPGTAADPLQKNERWGRWLEKKGKARKTPTSPACQGSAPISRLSAHIEHHEEQHVDSATSAIGQRVSGLETQLEVAQRRVESQEDILQAMFEKQMSKIEELLAPKRARKEAANE